MIYIIFTISMLCNVLLVAHTIKNKNRDIELAKIEQDNKTLNENIAELKQRNESLTKENNILSVKNGVLEDKFSQEVSRREEYYKSLNEKIEINFKNISGEILKQQQKDFETKQIDTLQPFKQQITEFKSRIEDINKINIENKTSLEAQIKILTDNNNNLQKEARDLTNALKGDKKTQGNWGEIQLENLFRITNLKEGLDYVKQETTSGENGEIHRPDFIINLPNDKQIIIDSKVSLNNYKLYLEAENEADRDKYLKNYIGDLKSHIKELGNKNYNKDKEIKKTLSYVFMFVPLERAYIDVLDHAKKDNTDIFKCANENNVAIATPSSLMPILRIIEHLWSIEKYNKNTEEIADLGKRIYEKLCGFQEDMQKLEKNIDNAKDSYNNVYNKLYIGRDNVMRNAEKLKDYGIVTSKKILLPETGDDKNS
ncbi:MAG: DNA recombination protein RmuC [Rickettsiales bacterium]|nr:DNA recombination protein RmuC [Rickettsiales bacterium]